MPASDLAASIAKVRRRHEAGELPHVPIRFGPKLTNDILDLAFYVQLMLEEVEKHRKLSRAEGEQEPWLTMRRAPAEEFPRHQRATATQR